MFTLHATFQDFYRAGTAVHVSLPCSWPQLIRAAATVGRDVSWASADAGSTFLRHERTWRVAMMRACLQQSADIPAARVVRTGAYATLDPSEKGAVSFFLGQATAKYVAEVMFGCIIFSHVDSALRYCRQPAVGNRPDFIGLCGDGRTLVVEAKGRSGSLGGVLSGAKRQLGGIWSADLTYAHASYFRGRELRVAMLDPEASAAEEVPIGGVLLAHYHPLRQLIAGGVERTVGGMPYRVRSFDALDVEFGLPMALLEELQSMEANKLAAEVVLQRRRERVRSRLVEDVPSQISRSRDDELRRAAGAAAEGRGVDHLTPVVQMAKPVSHDENLSTRRRSGRRRVRRLEADPELRAISASATGARGLLADDESFVSVGRAWDPDEMSLKPTERGSQ